MAKEQRDTILIADHMEASRAILRGALEKEYRVMEADTGEQALAIMTQHASILALALVDASLPGQDGYQVLAEMGRRGLLSDIAVIFISAKDAGESEVRAFDLGASDTVMKPFEVQVVKRRVQNIIELTHHRLHLEELVEAQAQSLQASNEIMTDALSSVIEYRSMESGQHVLRIRSFTRILLRNVARCFLEYDLDEHKIDVISRAAAMHDIGKIAVPDSVLNKPGPLTDEEFEIMKTHSARGSDMIRSFERLNDQEYLHYAYAICRWHHERWDGKGYPDGLRGDNIPVYAQVVGIADCYDALTTDRVYKKAYSHNKAMNMILNGECGLFSPKLLECLKNVADEFCALARDYADGLTPGVDLVSRVLTESVRPVESADTAQLGQNKYLALLRFLNAPVLEVNLDIDIYHMVYRPNEDFDSLRSGTTFTESFDCFVNNCVHPEDQERIKGTMREYVERFLAEGLMKKSREYRVFQRSTGAYRRYRATILRVDMDDPRVRRALLIWRDIEETATPVVSLEQEELLSRNFPGGVSRCRNDTAFTLTKPYGGFASVFGYTEEDLERRFQDKFLNLVWPDDRSDVLRAVRSQLEKGNELELEYRVQCKDGSILWVLDKGKLVEENGEEFIYSILVDVTHTKRAQEELRLTLERHQIIMDQTNDIIFEWDIASDKVTYSPNWEKKFGYRPANDEVRGRLAVASHIHPDDLGNYNTLIRHIMIGEPYNSTEYRVAKSDGRYLWCRVRTTTQFNTQSRPIKAVGVIQDVDDEVRKTKELQAKAEQDVLTGLYNKLAARKRTERCLTQCNLLSMGALLMLDVDNFKLVNDLHGHLFGDAVLAQIADQIRGGFRSEDVSARIGGDEFLVFMPGLTSREPALRRAEAILRDFETMFGDSLEECRLSCSIGIAFAPEDGDNYQDLFQKTDQALGAAKLQGKNRVVVYSKELDALHFLGTAEQSALGARIDSDEQTDAHESELIRFALKTLYRSGDIEEAVSAILSLVGREFDVSRAYIFEDTEDGRYCCNTFEWCNEGVAPQIRALSRVNYEDELDGRYMDNFNEEGIFYCPDVRDLPAGQRDVLEPQGIKSMLQCAIRDNGRFRGFVGFDDDFSNRLWTKRQIDAISFTAELLSVFLLKKRAQDRAERMADSLSMAMDNQSSWIYIIDPDTYEILYLNKQTRLIAPDADVGICCHKAFFHRDSPCEQCPACDIRRVVNRTLEVYNPVLKVWSAADASLMKWNDKDACLLTCRDITSYKKPGVSTE